MKNRPTTSLVGLVVLGSISVALLGFGCDLVTFLQGPAGPQGPPGLDAGSSLPGTTIEILSVAGGLGGAVTAGGPFSVTFTVKTAGEDGEAIDIDDLDRFAIYVSGPATNYQRVIVSEDERDTSVAKNSDGSYTYTFAGGFPSTYAAPLNDSDFFGSTDGELTGTAIQAGTYTVAIEARRTFNIEGESVRDADDATFDFAVGGATVTPRQVVLQANCEKCHNRMTMHGGNRFSLTGCVLCHTKGAEDRISEDAAKATTGTTIHFAHMIHRIHKGFELRQVEATENGTDPWEYEVIGYGESVHDFSHVEFPRMPGGTGFNQQTRNCDACHGGASQASNIGTPNRSACTGCHDDLDFTSGTILDEDNQAVQDGTLTQAQLSDASFRTAPGGTAHQFADDQCTLCHNSGSSALDPAVLHTPVLANTSNTNGLQVEIQSVEGGSGAGFFMIGDNLVITFQFVDRDGNAVDIGDIASVRLVVSGPVENYQKIIPDGSTPVSLIGAGGVPASGTGPFTYTSPEAIPATYPAPLNDSAAFDFAGGWGELTGRALIDGSYTVMVYAYRTVTVDGTDYHESSLPGLAQIRIGSTGSTPGYPDFVTDEKCNACHGNLRIHGNTRRGVKKCVMCHNAGAEDLVGPPSSGSEAPEADTIDFKVMIHKIHNAKNLDVVTNSGRAGVYDIIGDGSSLHTYSTGILCSMPGETKHCDVCHATDAWKKPVERSDVNVWKVACTSCHDSVAVAAHVALNTDTSGGLPGTEACATCHGDGAFFSIENVHLVR